MSAQYDGPNTFEEIQKDTLFECIVSYEREVWTLKNICKEPLLASKTDYLRSVGISKLDHIANNILEKE